MAGGRRRGKLHAMPLMRRRPLLRAAMVGGGAYVAGKHVERGREQEAEPQQTAEQPQAGGGMSDASIEQLQKLGKLRDDGILTPAEFEAQKAKLLG
jgi:Short C-terminal domain